MVSKKRIVCIVEDEDGGYTEVSLESPISRARKPKRSPSGYHLFMSVHTNAYKEANPEKNQTEVMTVIARKWTESTEEEKAVYLTQAATLKAAYEQKLKTYNESRVEDDNTQDTGELKKAKHIQ